MISHMKKSTRTKELKLSTTGNSLLRLSSRNKKIDKINTIDNSQEEKMMKHINNNNRFICVQNNLITNLILVIFYILVNMISFTLALQMSSLPSAKVRLCVTIGDYNECLQMSNLSNGTLTCVKARDRYECMKHIIDDRADIVNLNNEELYLAGRLYNLEPFAMEQYNGDTQHYKSVVIINNKANINSIADLKGKRSCHGGYNSTQGWNIPIGLLLATLTMTPDCRGELYSVSKFFDQSCAPGPWSSDQYIDAELKKLHPSLCAACQNSTTCSSNDEFAGDEGALKCLLSGYGQVAFTTSKTIERFISRDRLDRRLLNNFVYLCLDGTKLPLDSTPCEWAHKPTNVFVTAPSTVPTSTTSSSSSSSSSSLTNGFSRQEIKEYYLNVLQQLFYRFVPYKPSWWRMRSLFSDSNHVTQILPVPKHLQLWDKYLGNYISSIEKPLPGCDPNSITFCTSSQLEELKCLDLQKAAFSQRIRPEIDCKRRPTKADCLDMVSKRQADLVSIDLSNLYETQQAIIQQLEPIAIAQNSEQDYSVAVVRADSGIKFLYQLGGRRSCHGSFGDTASWLAPISVLSERSLLDQQACNKADQMADYFGQSCVPGAADLRINLYRSGSEKLCALCRGHPLDGQHQCERSQFERYYGHTGALRCLVEGAGEVAFLSLGSLAANVDGRSLEPWARGVPLALDSRNFRLICRSGPSMLLGDYESCHLARLPGKIIVSTKFTSKEERITNRRLLIWLEEKFLYESREMFDLFGTYQNETDLLFDDLTKKITPIQLEMSNFDLVGRQHLDPSFQQLSISNRDSNCKLVLTSSALTRIVGYKENNQIVQLLFFSSIILLSTISINRNVFLIF